MQEQGREVGRASRERVVRKSSSSAPVRHARGTEPPPELSGETVVCKTCNARVPFASANVLASHCVCAACSLADARTAALAALPKNGDTTKLPHQLGAPLVMLVVTAVFTVVLVAIYNF